MSISNDHRKRPVEKSPAPFFTASELAQRWGVTRQNLANLRHRGSGPVFMKLGGNVRYAVEDVEAYEETHRFQRTDQPA